MAGTAKPGYGTPNWEMLQRWLALPAEDDGPFWALNLMKYRTVAEYGDDHDGGIVSGKEADDAYAPLGPLAAIGATVVFHGDVLEQRAGDPAWDRIGIVRYPTRASFFAMQQRDDFKDQHVHKEAGMEFTIVMACHPDDTAGDGAADGRLALVVTRSDSAPPIVDGIESVVTCTVEGVIVGDDVALDALVAAVGAADEAHVLVVDRAIDRLVGSVGPEAS
jgi:hypothetical protein